MSAQSFGDVTRRFLLTIVDAQPTPEKRREFAEIAHQHGHLTDAQLATYATELREAAE